MANPQDTISIPVAYIEAFFMMLGAFLIGYIGCYLYYNNLLKKERAASKKMRMGLTNKIRDLKDEIAHNDRLEYQKDRMDQDFKQVKFQQRAYSDRILTENIDKKPVINFEVIGHPAQGEKDNLQEINGIGPYTEAKLNDLGIFTFEQISKFTDDDISTITDLIKFFPDRIKNDQWVGKARNLIFNKSASRDEGDNKKKMTPERVTKKQ